MKKITIVLVIILGLVGSSSAQEQNLNNGFGFGFQLNEYQNDFGLGLNITSPLIANNRLALRLRANLIFNENIQNNETVWTPYSNISLGLVGLAGTINNRIRLYGEGGIIALFPSSDFSTESIKIGGYGVFGFEFFFHKGGNYFIEIGGVGTGAVADKIENKPIYSNGLLISTGFRFYLD